MTDTAATGLRRAILVNDLSCFGKCSLSVGLPILSAVGVEALALPTALLSTHTGGFSGYAFWPLTGQMQAILRHWRSLSLRADAVATGYFGAPEQMEAVKELCGQLPGGALLLVDPVMADGGRLYPGFSAPFVQAMRALCAGADILTPNLTEALLLADMPFEPQPTAGCLCRCLAQLQALGAKQAVITGVPWSPSLAQLPARRLWPGVPGAQIGYVCTTPQGPAALWHPFAATALHGCGDVFAAALLAALLAPAGDARPAVPELSPFAGAVYTAAVFTARCVRATDPSRYPGHWYGLRFEECLAQGFWQTDGA